MKLVRHEIESENESRLMWSGNGATQYRIVNTDKPNRYGEYRGYRILPSQGTIHLAVKNSSNLGMAANWAYHDLAVSLNDLAECHREVPRISEDLWHISTFVNTSAVFR